MPTTGERFERLADLLDLAAQMSRGDPGPFSGSHYQLAHPENRPLPLTVGGIPVLVGGMGPRRTLRLVARYAHACNLFDIPDDGATILQRLDLLRRHCQDLGTSYAAIGKTISTRLEPGETPQSLARRLRRMHAWGIDHAIVIRPGPWTPSSVQTLAEAADTVRDL